MCHFCGSLACALVNQGNKHNELKLMIYKPDKRYRKPTLMPFAHDK